MRTYRINEAILAIPDAWVDQSINIFASPAIGGNGTSFVVSREPVGPHADLGAYVRAQIDAFRPEVEDFALLREEEQVIDGVAGLAVEYSWRSDSGEVRQYQAHVITEGVVLSCTYTVPAQASSRAAATFTALLAGISLGRE